MPKPPRQRLTVLPVVIHRVYVTMVRFRHQTLVILRSVQTKTTWFVLGRYHQRLDKFGHKENMVRFKKTLCLIKVRHKMTLGIRREVKSSFLLDSCVCVCGPPLERPPLHLLVPLLFQKNVAPHHLPSENDADVFILQEHSNIAHPSLTTSFLIEEMNGLSKL